MITTFEALAALLNELPAPQPGRVRVFRGQARDHGSMIPASIRNRHVDGHLFNVQCFSLAQHLMSTPGHAAVDDAHVWLVWVQAIAQHYGPGSQFLDVTNSVDVALWFALNAARQPKTLHVLGAPGPLDPRKDRIAAIGAVGFTRVQESGRLYVFDVAPWNGNGAPSHGEFVDLRSAPPLFSDSPRLQAQSAALIAANAEVDGGDLSAFMVAGPIEIGWPMTGSRCGSFEAAGLFPSPDDDSWYSRFLSMPLVNRYDREERRVVLSQAIPVTLYVTDQAATTSASRRIITLPPDLLWPYLVDKAPGEGWLPAGFAPADDTVPILLELPAFKLMPPLAKNWNHGVTVSDLPNEATVFDPHTGKTSRVPVANVFVEFSPMELDDWSDVEADDVDRHGFIRGAYLERRDNGLWLWLAEQAFPSCRVTVGGPYHYVYDAGTNRLVIPGIGKNLDGSEAPFSTKTLLTVLTLLRELSDGLLALPFPLLHEPGVAQALVGIQGGAVRLVAADRMFVMYDQTRDRTYDGTSARGSLSIPCPEGWENLEPTTVRAAITTVGGSGGSATWA